MNSKTWNALIGAAGAVLSAAAIGEGISRAIDSNMVGEALDRREPPTLQRFKKRIRGYSLDEEALTALDLLASRLESSPHRVVQMKSFDGTRLTGHLFEVSGANRVIVAMHGWRSRWSRDFGMVADFLSRNGCTVLYAEQRGQGESGGEYMGFGMIERFDCLAWSRWMNENGFAELPQYLIGVSMGATTVLMAAGAEDLPGNVAGMIADCGFTSAKAIWKHISEKNLRIPYRRREKHLDDLCRRRIDLESDAYTTLEAMKTAKVPILFIHGEADTFVPVQMSRENFEACRAPKQLLTIPGANHGMSYVVDRQRYEGAVLDFWEKQEGLQNGTRCDRIW